MANVIEDKDEYVLTDETEKKVYRALLEAGVYGQQALDVIESIQGEGVFFREKKPKRRGRPPKSTEDKPLAAVVVQEVVDAWSPGGEPSA